MSKNKFESEGRTGPHGYSSRSSNIKILDTTRSVDRCSFVLPGQAETPGPGAYLSDKFASCCGNHQAFIATRKNSPKCTITSRHNESKHKQYLCTDKGEIIEQMSICRHSPGKHYQGGESKSHEKYIKK